MRNAHSRASQAMPDPGLLMMQEIDFVLSDLSLEVIGDFAIIWLLSPKKSFGRAPQGGLSHFASGLPGHTLQVSTLRHFTPISLSDTLIAEGAGCPICSQWRVSHVHVCRAAQQQL